MKKRILIGVCILIGAVLVFEGYYYISTSINKNNATEDTSKETNNNNKDNGTDSNTSNEVRSDEEYINDLEDSLDTAIDTLNKIDSTESNLGSTVE